ncbi:DEAD/DEAH box helicase [Litoreibacter janthinus]|uniref:DEAD-box ATP-dependent RNA helicase RhpA n=1 Tax=Litoreibacter janthinus TaxID=670154 RepID=A0A1I6HIR1_9RHOB|nr:DEAD/DEAH box helicase [Litoreibacter janthinus]SFR54177.1 Superfamily II DNA and RNA helicase [Litoreibacter janthinus]
MIKFSDLKLHAKVLKAIDEVGYTEPTPIQAGAIPPALEGRDVLGIAQTGTGKTASFTLPMITLLNRGRARARMPRSLVLAPTRELAAQVAENFDLYAKHTKLTKALLIGGVSFKEQDALIDRGVDVLIATPGRLLDHFERGKLILSDVKVMVVDEADRMLDMGFIPDIERIFQMTPFTRQTLFFSATMAPEIERITNTFLSNPERIEVARQASASATITQLLFELPGTRRDALAKQKRDFLRKLIDQEGEKVTNGIIFCNRKVDVDIVAKSLKKYGHDAEPIHGDLDQSHRTRTLEGFRDGKIRFLVASDVAARGLDIPNVSHVFNFDVPSHAEDYVHRIGRTGRAGRLGTAMMISTPKDEKLLAAIQSLIETTIPRGDVGEQKAPVSKASEADVAAGATEERPKSRSRSRSRSSSKPKDDAKADAPVADANVAEEARDVKPEPKAQKAAPAPQKEQQSREQEPRESASSSSSSNSSSSSSRSRGGKGRSRNDDRGPKVVGLGDHLPTFIEKSFAERRTD